MSVSKEEMQKRELILQNYRVGIGARQTTKDILLKFGSNEFYSFRTCQRWIDKFKSGNFDLRNKDFDRSNETRKPRKGKKKKTTPIEVKQVKFQVEREQTNKKTNKDELQSIMNKKPEITVSKVTAAGTKKPPFQPSVITTRTVEKSSSLQNESSTNDFPRSLRPRTVPTEVNLKLTPNLVKRMTTQSSTENHTIGKRAAENSYLGGENNAITVQFQNINSDIAKNTVRKTRSIEKSQEPLPKKIRPAVDIRQSTTLKADIGKKSMSDLNLREDNLVNRNTTSGHVKYAGRKTHSFGARSDSVNKSSVELAQNKSYNSLNAKITTKKVHSLGRISLPANVENIDLATNFQNINSALTKNTMRKTSDTGNPRIAHTQPNQATPLNPTKGIIYLNPQEIFRQSFGKIEKPPTKRPDQLLKPVQKIVKAPTPLAQPISLPQTQSKNDCLIINDSDSETSDCDLIFPEDVVLPPPKVKSVCNTFTTYFDIDKDKPILLNSADETMPPSVPVIEID